jgi:methionyl-tRNA synthetase
VETDQDAAVHLNEVLAHCVGNLLQVADLLVPFMPATAQSIHAMFETGVVVPATGVLFPKIYQHSGQAAAGSATPQPSK